MLFFLVWFHTVFTAFSNACASVWSRTTRGVSFIARSFSLGGPRMELPLVAIAGDPALVKEHLPPRYSPIPASSLPRPAVARNRETKQRQLKRGAHASRSLAHELFYDTSPMAVYTSVSNACSHRFDGSRFHLDVCSPSSNSGDEPSSPAFYVDTSPSVYSTAPSTPSEYSPQFSIISRSEPVAIMDVDDRVLSGLLISDVRDTKRRQGFMKAPSYPSDAPAPWLTGFADDSPATSSTPSSTVSSSSESPALTDIIEAHVPEVSKDIQEPTLPQDLNTTEPSTDKESLFDPRPTEIESTPNNIMDKCMSLKTRIDSWSNSWVPTSPDDITDTDDESIYSSDSYPYELDTPALAEDTPEADTLEHPWSVPEIVLTPPSRPSSPVSDDDEDDSCSMFDESVDAFDNEPIQSGMMCTTQSTATGLSEVDISTFEDDDEEDTSDSLDLSASIGGPSASLSDLSVYTPPPAPTFNACSNEGALVQTTTRNYLNPEDAFAIFESLSTANLTPTRAAPEPESDSDSDSEYDEYTIAFIAACKAISRTDSEPSSSTAAWRKTTILESTDEDTSSDEEHPSSRFSDSDDDDDCREEFQGVKTMREARRRMSLAPVRPPLAAPSATLDVIVEEEEEVGEGEASEEEAPPIGDDCDAADMNPQHEATPGPLPDNGHPASPIEDPSPGASKRRRWTLFEPRVTSARATKAAAHKKHSSAPVSLFLGWMNRSTPPPSKSVGPKSRPSTMLFGSSKSRSNKRQSVLRPLVLPQQLAMRGYHGDGAEAPSPSSEGSPTTPSWALSFGRLFGKSSSPTSSVSSASPLVLDGESSPRSTFVPFRRTWSSSRRTRIGSASTSTTVTSGTVKSGTHSKTPAAERDQGGSQWSDSGSEGYCADEEFSGVNRF